MDRNDLLCYNTRNKSKRTPFVITWHQQLQGIPKVTHCAYKAVIKKYPGFQNRASNSCISKTKKSNVTLSQT